MRGNENVRWPTTIGGWRTGSEWRDQGLSIPSKTMQPSVFAANFFHTSGRIWKNLCHRLSSHEKSHDHLDSFHRWKELEIRLLYKQTIDAQAQRAIDGETTNWQQLIRLMATQNIALRGTTDWLNKPNNGNILKFVEMLGIFDGIMKKHVRRVQPKDTRVNYLGKRIQNEIIDMLAEEFQQTVCSELKAARYVSIILVCTPDKSKTDQMTTVVHFVSTEDDGSVRTREHFLEFSELLDATGWA